MSEWKPTEDSRLCGQPCEQHDDCDRPCIRAVDHTGRHECKNHAPFIADMAGTDRKGIRDELLR